MKLFPRISAILLVLTTGFFQPTSADTVAIVLDDSVSMCGYFARDKVTAYESLLMSLQDAILSTEDSISLNRLDKHVALSATRTGVSGDLERLAGTSSLPDASEQDCAFHAKTSRLGNVFSYNNAGLALLVTDFIFDDGPKNGSSSSKVAFVDDFVNWSQGKTTNTSKNKHKKTGEPTNETSSSALAVSQYSAGIIALRSAFDGKYFLQESGNTKTSIPIKIDSRPVYLFWRAESSDLAKRWLKPIMVYLANKNINAMTFQLFPSVTKIDPNSSGLDFSVRSLAEMADSIKPQLRYANLPYERALETKSQHDGLENPIDASANPASCFSTKGFAVFYDISCSKGGEREQLFWQHHQIDEIRIEFVLEQGMSGLERSFTTTSTEFRTHSYRVDYKPSANGNSIVSIALPKLGSGFFEHSGQNNRNDWVIELQEQLTIKPAQFDPDIMLKEWSSDAEPCEAGERCKADQTKTVGLQSVVKSIIERTKQNVKQPSLLQPQTVRVEFHKVEQLPN